MLWLDERMLDLLKLVSFGSGKRQEVGSREMKPTMGSVPNTPLALMTNVEASKQPCYE
jgi:hypothetical protein